MFYLSISEGPNEVFTDVHISDTKTGQEEGDSIHTRSGCQVSRIFTHIKGRQVWTGFPACSCDSLAELCRSPGRQSRRR